MPETPTRRCLVAICHNWPFTFTKTTQSLMELGWGDRVQRAQRAHGFSDIWFAWFYKSPRVDALRDMAAEQALRDDFTHILFLDADMQWPSDTLVRMLAHHDKGIVSGLYIQKYAPYYPIALRDGVTSPNGLTIYKHDTEIGTEPEAPLRPEQVVGMGCTLVPVEVFRQIGPRPWFSYENDGDGWPMVSEDVPLCRKATDAGFDVWLDPAVKCGHAVVSVIDEPYFRRYEASKRDSQSMPVTLTATGPKGSAA